MSSLISDDSSYLHKLGDLTEAERTTVTELVKAASEAIERYCRRTFGLSTYDETVTVGEYGYAVLSGFPVVSMDRVYTGRGELLTVSNTSATSASVSTNFTGLVLTSVSAGVTTTITRMYADYPTLSGLAASITGSGWAASVATGYGGFPSVDIGVGQFVRCRESAGLWSWLDDTGGSYEVDFDLGWLHVGSGCGHELRVHYTAGFDSVPESVQQVCADLVVASFDRTKGDGIASESLGDYSVTYVTESMSSLPLSAKSVLSLYRDRRP